MYQHRIKIDGVKWIVEGLSVQPLCPKHHLRLSIDTNNFTNCRLKCAECPGLYNFSREYTEQTEYILNKIDSKLFKNLKFINLDDEAVPLAETKLTTKDNKYFITALLTESKVGQRLVVYAGEKGKKEKVQIFIEPEIKRLSFDHTDVHPSEIFLKLEATFDDGIMHSISKPKGTPR